MTRIPPQALSCDPAGVDARSRLGVTLCGLGGLGVEVIDRLNNRFHGRPERIGLHALYVDSVRADGDAHSSGPFRLSFSAAESRFLASRADYGPVLADIEAGDPPGWAPPVTPSEARSIRTDKLPEMIGFGGQPVISFLAANLAWPEWEQRVERSLNAAATVDPAAEPLTVVIASLYGGTGIGHLPLFLDKLKDLGQENIAVFVALPSQAKGLLTPAQVPEAHARGIAGLRGLLRPGLYQHLFLVGSGNRVLRQDPRESAIEVIASTIAAWLENPEAFRSAQATWLGQDFQGATTVERLSALGAAEVMFPSDTLARRQSCYHAARAWQLVTEIGAVELNRATKDGGQFAWSNPMVAELDVVTKALPGTSSVAVFDNDEVHGKVQEVFTWFSIPLPETEPIEPLSVRSALARQPRTMPSVDLVRWANSRVREHTERVRTSLSEARALNLAAFQAMICKELADQLGVADGVRLADRPWVLRRATEFIGAAARRLEDTAQRIRSDLIRARDKREPVRVAREAVDVAERGLPAEIRTRGLLGPQGISPPAANYLDAVAVLVDVRMLDLALDQLADHLFALAALCAAHVDPLTTLVKELDAHRQACVAATSDFDQHLRHLRGQPTLIVVPAAEPALDALAEELARAAISDVPPDLERALLSRIKVRLEPGPQDQPGHPILEAHGASDGTVSLIAASYLPVLAYSWLRPQYASCTLTNALAADYAHGWAADQGGHADRELITQFLDEKVISPLLNAGASTVELVRAASGTRPVPRRSVHLDQRPARTLSSVAGGTAELVAEVVADLLTGADVLVVGGAPGRATMTTIINKVPWHRVVEFGGQVLDNYHRGTRLPVHLDAAALRAYDIERKAREAGHLRGRDRILDPDVMLLLDDPDALWGFMSLIATGRMPVFHENPSDPSARVYRIDLTSLGPSRTPQWRRLGPVNDPLAALLELFQNHDSRRLREAVVATWQQAWAKLVVDCGSDSHRAHDMLQIAVRELNLPVGDSGQRFAADVAILRKVKLDTF
ncbi:MAG: hypothetical protein ACRDS1_01385 [Pseudonocardiaceae bacterium]